MIKINLPFISLETKSTLLLLEVVDYDDKQSNFSGKKVIIQRYYGKKIDISGFEPTVIDNNHHGSNCDFNYQPYISSTYGNGCNREPLLLCDNPDNTYVNRFYFDDVKILNGGVEVKGPHARNCKETLEIIEKDDVLDVELHHFYSLIENSDVIVSKKQLVNKNDKEIVINRLFSLELPVPAKEVSVYSFDGQWLYERNRHETILKNGTFSIDSKTGTSSHKHNPFIYIKDNSSNQLYASNLIYSGNHKEIVEVDNLHFTSLLTGINDFTFAYKLKTNESFMTPEAIFITSDSIDDITKELHSFTLNNIINPNFAYKPRPIIFNNWEGTGVRIDEKSLLEMADIGAKIGIEQFVMDDGWFKGRVVDNRALGDWTADLDKFPNGLKAFSDKIKAKGLKFGIWVEPEMICLNSDLYRNHPEYAQIIPNRDPIQRRTQIMLDFSNPAVVDNIFNQLDAMIQECNPSYIKWDYNRFITDPYSSLPFNKGEYLYNFIYGVYDVMDRLTNKYPDLLFESCSSGGGRYDLGILYYMPQTWGSDDTNTYFRTFIACGTLTAYPQSTYGAHVSRDGSPNGVWCSSSLEDRFNLSCFGAFGYEFDLRTFPEDELQIMKEQIIFYKKYRDVLQYGTLYINNNCFDGGYFSMNVVNKDKSLSICLVEKINKKNPDILWKIKGLDDQNTYHVSIRKQYNNTGKSLEIGDFSGSELANIGIDLKDVINSSDAEKFPNGIETKLLIIEKK